MLRLQQIEWLTELLLMNDERVVQNIAQSVWAMAGTTALHLPGSKIDEEATTATAEQQQQTTSDRST